MSKWYGVIGFIDTLETTPGVWESIIVEVEMYGEMTRYSRRWEPAQSVNDNISVNSELSVIYDPTAVQKMITRIIPSKLVLVDGYVVFEDGRPLAVPTPVENLLTIQNIRYVDYRGSLWKVNSVDVQYPRLFLSVGGVYNGPQT